MQHETKILREPVFHDELLMDCIQFDKATADGTFARPLPPPPPPPHNPQPSQLT